MLVFAKGTWREVELPDYTDPSWGLVERTRAAYGLLAGKAWEEIEREIYSGISRKEHSSPENEEE